MQSENENQDNKNMASSVTRHVLIPVDSNLEDNFKLLLCGIDSLDVGLYVKWECDWEEFTSYFEQAKEHAQASDSALDTTADGREFIHLPAGKPNYRFHIQFPEYHLYIAIDKEAAHSPNLFLSLNSEAIWRLGVQGAFDLANSDIVSFGGMVERAQPSRCDFCADFKLPFSPTIDFMKMHRVSRARGAAYHTDGENLETYYAASVKSPVRLRIYDKGKEIVKHHKAWFMELWGTEDLSNIWRVEFQLRRPVLKQFNIYTLEDLTHYSYGIWLYLTGQWFSLRLPDNEKQDRRFLHPWWQFVHDCGKHFGPAITVKRDFESKDIANEKWYVSHIAGCLPSYAARCGAKTEEDAMDTLRSKVGLYWTNKRFEDELVKRTIKLGLTPEKSNEAGDGSEE